MADTKSVGPYEFQVPLKGVNPWDGLADVLFDDIGDKMETNRSKAVTRPVLRWGDTDASLAYLQTEHGTGLKVFGSLDRQNLPVKNQTIEIAAKPAAPTAARVLVDDDKLWFAGKGGAVPVWVPVTRPTLTVEPTAVGSRQLAEFSSISAAIAALPSGGGTIELLPGTYAVPAELVLATGTRLVGLGDGVVLDFSTVAAAAIRIQDKKDIVIENIQFTGAAAKSAIRIISTFDGAAARIQIKNCRFAACKNAIEMLESGGDWQVDDVLVADCYFDGANAACESGVYSETEARRVLIRDCFFTGWGNGGARGAVEFRGNAGAGIIRIAGCSFSATGTSSLDSAVLLDDVDDTFVSHCTFKSINGGAVVGNALLRFVLADCIVDTPTAHGVYLLTVEDVLVRSVVVRNPGGDGVHIETCTRASISDVIVTAPSGLTSCCFFLAAVNDSTITGCSGRTAVLDGFRVMSCDRTVFAGCEGNSNSQYGFNLLGGTYLVFSGCIARTNATADLAKTGINTLADCRLGFTLSGAPAGTWDASNGVRRSVPVPIRGWSAVDGGPAEMAQVGMSKRFGWAFSATMDEIITGDWIIPEQVLPGSSINFRVWYVANIAPGVGNDSVSFTLNVLETNPGTTLIDDAGVTSTTSNQAVSVVKRVERSAAMVHTFTAAERAVQLQLKRTPTQVDDDYPNDVYVVGMEAEVVFTEIEVRA